MALLFFALAPENVCAQKAARIRATARIRASAVPEVKEATAQRISQLSQSRADSTEQNFNSIMTSRGIAHIFTERISSVRKPSRDSKSKAPQRSDQAGEETHMRLTIAFTAN